MPKNVEVAKWPWNIGRSWKSFDMHATKSQDCMKRLLIEMCTLKVILVRNSERKEEHVKGNWRKSDLCYKTASCSSVLKRVQILSNEFRHSAEENLSKILKALPHFSLLLIVKCDQSGEGIVTQKVPGLKDLGNSQSIHIAKNEKACSGESIKSVIGQYSAMDVTHGLISHLSRSQE